ncbi:2Fe-2S iron-sulfur cluster-binding protein [Bradyrhizobium sp. BWA-3-5]|uniref:2Fe-2S iron-sulfur cluster-binding protein n=1 Tax=Bradyrhizobium sp. BWA-3-5 TaxID=3080013 RepID=UPI00293F269C|nr:2Fe-2S iron-sulfur cluster-binding protein [Bradyrhizobium sp. BWA-3-5]WOH67168.1 2Fe-2S iron-sulfur cluster-binding protein [Bradyrhizobium sp. BWA-3-5]
MTKICKVTINDEPFLANRGELLLDWALMNGVDLPHDCRSGICGACRVRLVDGQVYGGHSPGDEMIHACQARIVSDLAISIEAAPEPVALTAEVAQTVQLAPDVVGVDIELPKPLDYLPGQYCKLQFHGFPARSYSPTFPLEGSPHDHLLHFHIRKVSGGLVSSALGHDIRPGHRVKLMGPYGRAFFRQGHEGRIVLVASGTGFAPMWSVAVAAIMEQPKREMVFIVQARSLRSLYMHTALCRLALFPNVTLIPMVSEPQQVSHAVRSGGRPTDHLPKLTPNDVVYTAGAPAMTDAVARIAKAAGAQCYTDPFVQEARTVEQPGLMSRLTGWLNEPKSAIPLQPSQKPAPMPRGAAAIGVGNR